MSNYHFPVLFGEHRSERVVMIHLADDESDSKNRVIITKGSNDQPLFRIPNEVKLIDDGDTGVVHFMEVDFMGWFEMEEKRLKHEASIKKVKKQIDNLNKKAQLTTSDQKKYESLLDKCKALDDGSFEADLDKMKGKLKGKNVLKVESGGAAVVVKEEGDYYEYYVKDNKKGIFEADIVFSLTTNYDSLEQSIVYQGKIHVVRPLDADVVKINVDLGSDATQVNYFLSSSGIGTQPVDLVRSLIDLYTDRKYNDLQMPVLSEPLFIQSEKKHPYYYKTGNITFRNGGKMGEDINDEKTFINYLNVSAAGKNVSANQTIKADTWDKESAFNKKLMNIKMLYANIRTLGGYYANFYYIKNNDDKSKYFLANKDCLLEVLRSIYRQILEATAASIQGHKYYSVLLLVPNIYVQINIDQLLSQLNEKFNDLTKDDAVRYDFRVISESDAAFAGIKHANTKGGSVLERIVRGETDSKQKDMFLIIDSGKGTTDYSIVRYDKTSTVNNSMSSIARDGIVGAGGAIDYVFARVLARQIYVNMVKSMSATIAEEAFVGRFMTMINMLDPVYQDTMMLMVELLKKEYKCNKKTKKCETAKVHPCFGQNESKIIINNLIADTVNYNNINGQIEAWKEIAQWEWDKSFINTDEKDNAEVKWVCNAIADAIITRVFEDNPKKLTNQIDYVIFTGRSFLFEPLKKAFVERIQPHRGVFPVNYEYPLFFVKLISKFSRKKKELENLKVAPMQDFDMKAISVDFAEHDLGMNCNSDLCCMDLLTVCGEDGQPTFKQDLFWKGFTTNAGQKCYYIGHHSKSFAPALLQDTTIRRNPQGAELSLVNMTLFPVYYVNLDLDTLATATTSKSQNQNRDALIDADDQQTPPQSDGAILN